MLLAVGVRCRAARGRGAGEGQVVDAAMVDGAALLMTPIYAMRRAAAGRTSAGSTCSTAARPSTTPTSAPTGAGSRSARSSRSSTPSWSGSPGSAAPRRGLDRNDPANWPALRAARRACSGPAPADDWAALFEPHRCLRRAGAGLAGGAGAPAPSRPARLRRARRHLQPARRRGSAATPAAIGRPPPLRGEHTDELLAELGLDGEQDPPAPRGRGSCLSRPPRAAGVPTGPERLPPRSRTGHGPVRSRCSQASRSGGASQRPGRGSAPSSSAVSSSAARPGRAPAEERRSGP